MALNELHFHFHSRRPTPWAAGALFVGAVVLVAIGVSQGDNRPAIGAILPGAIALALLASRPPDLEGTIEEGGIVLSRPAVFIPFEDVGRIEIPSGRRGPSPTSFPIRVHHARGLLKIPGTPGIDSAAIHGALTENFRPGGSRSITPALHAYLLRHEANFGADRIWTYGPNVHRGRNIHRNRSPLAVSVAILITGLAWAAASASSKELELPFGPMAVFAVLIGAFAVPISWLAGGRTRIMGIKNWRASSLVITPVGLALSQGDVVGELLWDQLRDVKYKASKSFRLSHDADLSGIVLVVEEARIVIADVYDRPLQAIHDRILSYWRPDRLGRPLDP